MTPPVGLQGKGSTSALVLGVMAPRSSSGVRRNLEKGFTKYTPNAGLSDLRAAVSRYLKRRFGLEYAAVGQILVTVGGSEGLDGAFPCTSSK